MHQAYKSHGEDDQVAEHLLPVQVQEASKAQSLAVQEGQRKSVRSGKKTLRQQAARLRRSKEANLPQESKGHQEDFAQVSL